MPSRGVAKPEDSVHPLTRQWASRIGNRAVRDAFLAHPIEDYTSSHELSVWTGTWNTNGKRPPPGLDISPWLDAVVSKPDIVVVGFQEIVPLTPGKVLAVEDEKATKEWEAIIERALHEGGGGGPPQVLGYSNHSSPSSLPPLSHRPISLDPRALAVGFRRSISRLSQSESARPCAVACRLLYKRCPYIIDR